jgi:hypothetical protein
MTVDWMLIRRNEAMKHRIINAENGNMIRPFNVFTYPFLSLLDGALYRGVYFVIDGFKQSVTML